MNTTEDNTPCQHLVVLTGDESRLDQLCAGGFLLANVLPAPSQLHDADETDVIAFHLLYGQMQEAHRISDEIGEDWPFDSPSPSSREVRDYLKGAPGVAQAAQRVLTHLQRTGHISARAWKKEFWGHASDLANVTIQRHQPGVATLRFTDEHSRLSALLTLALRDESVQVAAIVVDTRRLTQYWFDSATATGSKAFELQEQHFEDEGDLAVQSWLEHPPAGFHPV